MNAKEWLERVKMHDGGMVKFACDMLAAKDDLMTDLNAKIISQRNSIESLERALQAQRDAHVGTKRELEAARKAATRNATQIAVDRIIDFLYPRWVLYSGARPMGSAELFGIDPKNCVDERHVENAAGTSGYSRFDESSAEAEARETESLAHRIEMHDTRFRRVDERLGRHATKLTDLDRAVNHARDSRRKMHQEIESLDSRVRTHAEVGDKLITAVCGESHVMPAKPLIEQIAELRERVDKIYPIAHTHG